LTRLSEVLGDRKGTIVTAVTSSTIHLVGE